MMLVFFIVLVLFFKALCLFIFWLLFVTHLQLTMFILKCARQFLEASSCATSSSTHILAHYNPLKKPSIVILTPGTRGRYKISKTFQLQRPFPLWCFPLGNLWSFHLYNPRDEQFRARLARVFWQDEIWGFFRRMGVGAKKKKMSGSRCQAQFMSHSAQLSPVFLQGDFFNTILHEGAPTWHYNLKIGISSEMSISQDLDILICDQNNLKGQRSQPQYLTWNLK